MVSLLSAHGIVHAFTPGPKVLDGVDLELAPGELVALLGPNGAGKSTLIKVLARLLVPDEGEVSLEGRPIASWSQRQRARRLVYVPQEVRALPDVDVERFVASGRYPHVGSFRGPGREDRRAIEQALEAAGLSDRRRDLLAELSGGQRQRALLARAQAQGGRVLLMDEPTSSLDLRHQMWVLEQILFRVRAGLAAIVVTHDLNLASQFASRVVLLDAGRVAAEGHPREVLTDERLEQVFGAEVHRGQLRSRAWDEDRPFFVPWRR